MEPYFNSQHFRSRWYLGLAFLILTFGQRLEAAPIVYSFSGTGSGSIDTTLFTNAPFTVLIQGDTANVVPEPFFGSTFVSLKLSGTIAINEIGTAVFTPGNPPVCQPNCGLFVFGGKGLDVVGFGYWFDPGNFIAIAPSGVGLAGYDLASNFGPVVGDNLNLNQFQNVSTNLGALTYSSMSQVTFQSFIEVPEPAALTLMFWGLVALRGLRPRR